MSSLLQCIFRLHSSDDEENSLLTTKRKKHNDESSHKSKKKKKDKDKTKKVSTYSLNVFIHYFDFSKLML